MRGAGHLPVAEPVGVGLADRVAGRRLALGVEHHDGNAEVVAQQVQAFGDPGLAGAGGGPCDGHDLVADLERGAATEVHHEEEGVEAPGERLHAVEVRRQPGRRLRGTLGDDPAHLEAAHGVEVVPGSIGRHQVGDLGVDVERVVVARDRQRAVALRIPVAQALRVVRLTVHPDPLDGGGHVGVAVLEDLGAVAAGEVLVAGGDVVPQHDHRPVERGGVDRAQDHQAGLVGGALHRLDRPATVPSQLGAGGGPEADRLPLDEVLVGAVAHRSRGPRWAARTAIPCPR